MSLHGGASPQCPNFARSPSGGALPYDFFRKLRRQIAPRGEVRLALAVLEEAVGCLEGSQDAWNFPPRLFRWEAELWIESRNREPLFSFENICSMLYLDANNLRGQIRRWRAQQSGDEWRSFDSGHAAGPDSGKAMRSSSKRRHRFPFPS